MIFTLLIPLVKVMIQKRNLSSRGQVLFIQVEGGLDNILKLQAQVDALSSPTIIEMNL